MLTIAGVDKFEAVGRGQDLRDGGAERGRERHRTDTLHRIKLVVKYRGETGTDEVNVEDIVGDGDERSEASSPAGFDDDEADALGVEHDKVGCVVEYDEGENVEPLGLLGQKVRSVEDGLPQLRLERG